MYFDKREDYLEWNKKWFNEAKRVSKTIIIHFPKTKINLWYEIEFPYDIIFWNADNSEKSYGKASWITTLHAFICYGKFGKNRVKTDLITKHMKTKQYPFLIHPCPLNTSIIKTIISELKPKSVIDPFLGSGSTAEVCYELEIPFIGYEIEKQYEIDYNNRMNKIIDFNKQIEMF